MHRQDGSRVAIWSAEDAVAITALTRARAAMAEGGFRFVCRTRLPLRRAIRQLNQQLATLGFIKHPDKTFIGKISKGTDWMGFWLDDTGVNAPAPRAISNMLQTLRRLYEQTRHLTAIQRQGRVAQYLKHWLQWAGTGAGIAAAPVNTPVTVPLTT